MTARADAGWIEETKAGLIVHLARTKADQEAAGEEVGVPYGSHPETCPVRTYRAWLEASGISEGLTFRPIY